MAGTKAEHFVAFDLGAESGRAILGTFDGGRLTLEEKHRFANPNGRLNGHLHWNLLAQWEELKTGLKKAAGSQASSKVELSGIGVDTWGVDFGLIGPGGELLGTPFMYRDGRTDGVMEETFARIGKERLFDVTGIQFMQFNSLFQLLAYQKSGTALLGVAETLLFMPDLFNYLFTGKRVSEYSIASTSQMLDARTGNWAIALLEELGIPTRILPKIVPSGSIVGPLSTEVANETGCDVAPVIAPGCHDTASAVAAVPADDTRDDWCYISSGTWSLMGVELDAPVINAKSLELNYTNEGGVGGKIRFLKNIMGLWLVQECRRAFEVEGYKHSYSELTQMAERSKGFGALIDPEHKPFLTPGQYPAKITEFCKLTDQTPPTTRGEFVRTCLDSLALTYRKTLEGLEQILGKRINTIHIVGGGMQNELLNQMTADACGRTVVAGPIEATAIGNLLSQAMAVGSIKTLSEARKVVRESFPVKHYEPRASRQWEDAYGRYKAITSVRLNQDPGYFMEPKPLATS